VAETTCDGKKKMYELIADKKPVHILELTQKVNEEEAFSHWHSEVEKLKKKLETTFKITIVEKDLRDAIKAMNHERGLLREAFALGKEDPAIVTGKELADLRYRVAGEPGHLRMLEAFIAEAQQRKKAGKFVAKKGAPRILMTGCPTAQETTKLIEVIEECGAIVVVQETCSGVKPLEVQVEETGDPIEAIARKYFQLPCSCMTPNVGRTALIEKLSKEYKRMPWSILCGRPAMRTMSSPIETSSCAGKARHTYEGGDGLFDSDRERIEADTQVGGDERLF
jgi:benzoyl-CoA reductase/2-hydroxyglutaryl-CoA dehydratase subunit BcrC/BadD/HgdB